MWFKRIEVNELRLVGGTKDSIFYSRSKLREEVIYEHCEEHNSKLHINRPVYSPLPFKNLKEFFSYLSQLTQLDLQQLRHFVPRRIPYDKNVVDLRLSVSVTLHLKIFERVNIRFYPCGNIYIEFEDKNKGAKIHLNYHAGELTTVGQVIRDAMRHIRVHIRNLKQTESANKMEDKNEHSHLR